MASSTGAARIARARAEAAAPLPAGVRLSPAQWDQLIERIAALPTPSVGAKPSAAAVQDTAKP